MDKCCVICNKKENLKYIHLDGYINNENEKILLDNGIYVCDECLELCEKCDYCGKLKASQLIEIYITSDKYSWQNQFFCHCVETEKQKHDRHERETVKYNMIQSRKRFEELKSKLKKKGII